MQITPPLLTFLLCLSPLAIQAQVSLHIDLGLPPLPSLVVVQPGLQVVESFEDEVFFLNGWYWCRRPNGWYRSRSPKAHFYWVEARRVPSVLVRIPSGHYRNWHHGLPKHREHRKIQHERREAAHERRDERHERREATRERKEIRHEREKQEKHREGGEHRRNH